MVALPAKASFTGGTVTEGVFKSSMDDLRDYLAGLLGADGTLATARSTLAYEATANTWIALNTFVNTVDNAAASPIIKLYRNRANPAVDDLTGAISFTANNSAAAEITYTQLGSKLKNITAGVEASELIFETANAGARAARFFLGLGLYANGIAGLDKGSGSINASNVYDTNVLLTCYVLEQENKGTLDKAKWDKTVSDTVDDKGNSKSRVHQPLRDFEARATKDLDPKQYAAEWKVKGHLSALPSPADWAASDNAMSTGNIIQRLWETAEVQAVHINKLLERIEVLEAA